MPMRDMLEEVLEEIAPEWEANYYGDMLICPCGRQIELDGDCPKCGNPLKELAMI